uniref:Uncharacterized protein n=1 Tax=Triticum urartu TaxID=4572 RepID=A0A8R7PXI0_TRIUA
MEAEEHQTSLPAAKTVPSLLDSARLLLAARMAASPSSSGCRHGRDAAMPCGDAACVRVRSARGAGTVVVPLYVGARFRPQLPPLNSPNNLHGDGARNLGNRPM